MWLFIVGSIFSLWVVNAQSSIKNSVQAIESRVGLNATDMYTNIYNYDIMNALDNACETSPVKKWQWFVKAASALLDKKYTTMNNATILSDTTRLYTLVSTLNEKKIPAYDWNDYCKLKYAMIGLLQYLRDKHIWVLESTWVIKDFDGVDFSTIHWYQVKIDTLKMHNKKYWSYLSRVWTPLITAMHNPSFKNSLSQQQRSVLDETELLMKNLLAKSLYDLRSEWVIGQQDIAMIADKVEFEYVKECWLFNWRYEIKQTLDSNWNHIKYETTNLLLKVNLCPSYFVIRELPTLFTKIIVHELGHHVYYFKDTSSESFEAICWEWASQRNNTCSSWDFVSEYAQTAAVEDYAEHFMFWFLDIPISTTWILGEKTSHFIDL